MKARTLGRHAREGFRNLGRNGWMTFASISAVTVTLLLLGVFLLLAYNLGEISKQIEAQVEMNVFVVEGAGQAEIRELERQLKALPGVATTSFVSKEVALEQMREKLKDLLEGYDDADNPLPDKFVVKPTDPLQIEALSKRVETLPLVAKVNYGEETVTQMFQWTEWIRNAGGVFVVGLCFTALFLISNTIKVTIFARRKEIEIMKLVGATNWFIRWPFLFEGLLIGVLGSLLPMLAIYVAYDYLYVASAAFPMFQLAPVDPLVHTVLGILIAIGALIGMIGSVMSISRFLKV